MVGPSAELTTEWEGGSLSELVALLQVAAQPVRIEVIAPGMTDSNAGEVHLLAGGLADAFAGSLRRDDAMAALQRLEGARFVVEARLPDPESGSLSTSGPHEGSLKDRPVASLMRYCEDYVLTCRLEVWRGPERAVISYRRGEIISTMVGGADGSERLPDVMAWTEGSYDIVLPPPVLPQAPSRKGTARTVEPLGKAERRRHSTLPMTPGSMEGGAGSSGAGSAIPAPSRPSGGPAPQARPAATSQAPAGKSGPHPAPASTAAPPATASGPAVPAAQQPSPRKPATTEQVPAPGNASAAPLPVGPAAQAPKPAGAAQPARAAAPASATLRTTPVGPAAGQPATKAVGTSAAGPAQPADSDGKSPGRTLTPAMGSVAARVPADPLPAEATARGTPPVPPIPARAPAPPTPPTKSPAAATEQRSTKAAPPDSGAPRVPVAPTPPPFQLAQGTPGRPGKASASNDLKPASGTIEARSRHGKHLPPAAPPIEIADQPNPAPEPVNEVVVTSRPVTSRRARVVRKGLGDQPVKVYILIGLALGAGVVVAYWAYWYLPFFHH